MHTTTSHIYQNHLRICAWTTIPLITEDFLGFKSSIPTWRPTEDYIGWLYSGWVFFGSFFNHLFNQPHLQRTVGYNHILFFSHWWDPRSSDSGPTMSSYPPCIAVMGHSLPFFSPTHHQPTTQHAASGSLVKIHPNEWYPWLPEVQGFPAIGIVPTGFTGNSGLVLIIFMQE